MLRRLFEEKSIVSWVGTVLMFIFTYRIPVYVLMFLLIVAPLRYQYALAHLQLVWAALCFTSLIAFVYLFNKVTDHTEDTLNKNAGLIGAHTVRPTLRVALFCLLVPLLYLFFVPQYLPLYLGVAALGFLYSYYVPFRKMRYRLKNILFVKNVTSAITWSLIPISIRSLVLHRPIFDVGIANVFIGYFCIFLAFELLWDIRDIEGDRVAGVHTIANTFGVRTVQFIDTILALIYSYALLPHTFNPLFVIAILLSVILIWMATPQRGVWFYQSPIFVGIVFFFLLGFTS